MKLSINKKLFESYPNLQLGVLVAKGLDNTKQYPEVLAALRSAEERMREDFGDQPVTEHPKIHDWREAYRLFGAKPKKHRSSIEALVRRVLKGDELPDINTLVNVYNTISLLHLLPAGGDDLDKIDGDVLLTVADGNEPFTILGGGEQDHPKPGEVIYRDDKEVLCRRWNWRECDKTKMTESTTNAMLVLEALESTTKDELLAALAELKRSVEQFCGGTTHVFILDKENSSVELG